MVWGSVNTGHPAAGGAMLTSEGLVKYSISVLYERRITSND